jgi:hypothetical protein
MGMQAEPPLSILQHPSARCTRDGSASKHGDGYGSRQRRRWEVLALSPNNRGDQLISLVPSLGHQHPTQRPAPSRRLVLVSGSLWR